MYWETPKFMRLAFLKYLLYRGGLELNPQYLCGVPVNRALTHPSVAT